MIICFSFYYFGLFGWLLTFFVFPDHSFITQTKNAPVQSNPSPLNPVIQAHTKLPCAFVQPANSLQFPLFTAHSSMSEVYTSTHTAAKTHYRSRNFSLQDGLTNDAESVDTGKSVPIVLYTVMANKKLSYRRVTARCVLSVVILPITTQQCRNY